MVKKIALMLLVGLFLCGCGSNSTPEPTPPLRVEVSSTESPMIDATPTASMPENDVCGNPYYPVVDGTRWVYQGSEGQFTHTISTSAPDTFTITVESGDDTFIIQGFCSEGDISLLNVPGNSLSYTGSSGGSSMTTTSNEGVSLPGDIQLGDDWSQTIGVEVAAGNLSQSFTIETTYTALGYEAVSVPAGTFEALKIEQSSDMGSPNPTIQHLWYVQGVGLVKSDIVLQDQTITNELVMYNIP